MKLKDFAKISKILSEEHKETDIVKVFVDERFISQIPTSVINQIYVDIFTLLQGNGEFKEDFTIDGQLFVLETDLKNAPFGMMSDIHSL